jgi:hypothetical protein
MNTADWLTPAVAVAGLGLGIYNAVKAHRKEAVKLIL